jgi:hypothetical protein
MKTIESTSNRPKWTPNLHRAAERPRAEDWALDEPMTLYEAVAIHWPHGPAKVSTLRNEILAGRLPYRRIGNSYCVTREGLKMFGQCSLKGAAAQPGNKSIKSLLARARAARNGNPGSHPDASGS